MFVAPGVAVVFGGLSDVETSTKFVTTKPAKRKITETCIRRSAGRKIG